MEKTLQPVMNILHHKVWRISQGHWIAELKRIVWSSPLILQVWNWNPETIENTTAHCRAPTSSPECQSSLKHLLSLSLYVGFHWKILWYSINHCSSNWEETVNIQLDHLKMMKTCQCHRLYFLNSLISKSIINCFSS